MKSQNLQQILGYKITVEWFEEGAILETSSVGPEGVTVRGSTLE